MKILNSLGELYYNIDADSAMLFVDEALKISFHLNNEEGICAASVNGAAVLTMLGRMGEARKMVSDALVKMDTTTKVGKLRYAELCSNMCSAYREESNYKEALRWGILCLSIRERIGEKKYIMLSCYNLGALFSELGVSEKSRKYFELQLSLARELGDKIEEAVSLEALGVLDFEDKQFRASLEKLRLARAIFEKHGTLEDQLTLCINEGNSLDALGDAQNAMLKYLESERIAEETGQTYVLSNVYDNLSNAYKERNDWQKARAYAEKALRTAEESQSLKSIMDANASMVDILEHEGRMVEANKLLHKVLNLRDSLKGEEISRSLMELEIRYETERMEQANQLLSQANELNITRLAQRKTTIVAILLVTTFAALLAGIWFRQRTYRAQQRETELEQKLLRIQMNPHFIFNILQGLQQVVLQNNPLKANKLLTSFARLMRQTLEQSRLSEIGLDEEVKTLENYLSLQQNRFVGAWEYEIDIAEGLEDEQIRIPPMLLQPFVENAIEHGLRSKENGGRIDIRFFSTDDGSGLWAEVTDNGSGRTKTNTGTGEHQSLSTQITLERLALLKGKTSLEIIDLRDEQTQQSTGTKVRILLPLRKTHSQKDR